MLKALSVLVIALVFLSPRQAFSSSQSPVGRQRPPKAIYAPTLVYRAEWAKQGLARKGVVLVTIDPRTGKVTGARMLTSTGTKQLDGAALETYSKWRFQPGSVPQVKMPIEFATRRAQPAKRALPPPLILVLLLAIAVAAMGISKKKKSINQ